MSEFLIENLRRSIGKTITIFTTSGGISGGGFTGVLACVENDVVRLITSIGAAPACPIGSTCVGNTCGDGNFYGGYGGYGGYGNGYGNNCGGYGYGYGNNCGGYGYGYGNNCGGYGAGYGAGFGAGWGLGTNWLGAVAEIPICKIATFSHNAI